MNRAGLAQLKTAFETLGLSVIPSATNFLTLVLPSEQAAADLTQEMLARGVILRHLAPFGWPSLVRVTIGLEEENGYLIEVLAAFIKTVRTGKS